MPISVRSESALCAAGRATAEAHERTGHGAPRLFDHVFGGLVGQGEFLSRERCELQGHGELLGQIGIAQHLEKADDFPVQVVVDLDQRGA